MYKNLCISIPKFDAFDTFKNKFTYNSNFNNNEINEVIYSITIIISIKIISNITKKCIFKTMVLLS